MAAEDAGHSQGHVRPLGRRCCCPRTRLPAGVSLMLTPFYTPTGYLRTLGTRDMYLGVTTAFWLRKITRHSKHGALVVRHADEGLAGETGSCLGPGCAEGRPDGPWSSSGSCVRGPVGYCHPSISVCLKCPVKTKLLMINK